MWNNTCTAVVKKAQQRLYFLRNLKNNLLTPKLLVSFCHCSIESILTSCSCAWLSSCTAADGKALQKVAATAQTIVGFPLTSLDNLYGPCCLRRAQNILGCQTRPGHPMFELLPSGRCFGSLKARTNSKKKQFPWGTTALKAGKLVCY